MLAMAVVNHEGGGKDASKSEKVEDDILSTLNRLRQTLQECHGRVGVLNRQMDSLQPKFTKRTAPSLNHDFKEDKCGKYIGKVHPESNTIHSEMQNYTSINSDHKMNGIMNGNHKEVVKDLKGSSHNEKQALPSYAIPNKENHEIRDLVQSSLSNYIPDLNNINDPQELLLLAEKHANEICKMYQSQSNAIKKGQNLPTSEEKPVLYSNDGKSKEQHVYEETKTQYNGHHPVENSLEGKMNGDVHHIKNGLKIPEKRKLRSFVKRKEWWVEKHKEIEENSKKHEGVTRLGIPETNMEKLNAVMYHDWDSGYLEYEVPEIYNQELNGKIYSEKDIEDFVETESPDKSSKRLGFSGDLQLTKPMESSQYFPNDEDFIDELIKNMNQSECESDLMLQDDSLTTIINIDHTKREIPHRKRRRHILQRMRSIDLEDLPEENENVDTLQPSLEENGGTNNDNTESPAKETIPKNLSLPEEGWKMTQPKDTEESEIAPEHDNNEDAFIKIFAKQIPDTDIHELNSEMETTEESLDFRENLPQPLVEAKQIKCEGLSQPTEDRKTECEDLSNGISTLKNLLEDQNKNSIVCNSNTAQSISENTVMWKLNDLDIPNLDEKVNWKTNERENVSMQKMYKISGNSHKEYKPKKIRRRNNIMERLRNITYSEKVLLLTDKHAYSDNKVHNDMRSLLYTFISVLFLFLLLLIFYLLLAAPIVTVSFKHNGGPVAF